MASSNFGREQHPCCLRHHFYHRHRHVACRRYIRRTNATAAAPLPPPPLMTPPPLTPHVMRTSADKRAVENQRLPCRPVVPYADLGGGDSRPAACRSVRPRLRHRPPAEPPSAARAAGHCHYRAATDRPKWRSQSLLGTESGRRCAPRPHGAGAGGVIVGSSRQ